MPRRNGNSSYRKRRNKGQHQRKRSTRGNRAISKFKKYHWYNSPSRKEELQDRG